MRFAGVQDDSLADPFVVYLFRPGQIAQAGVVIFLELSVTHVISHAKKYPSPILSPAIPHFVTKKPGHWPVWEKNVPKLWNHGVYQTPRDMER